MAGSGALPSGGAPERLLLADRVERLVARLRALPDSRLARPADPSGAGPSIADSAHALAQVLADLAADLEARPRREVPRLHDLASGDQVAVTAHDLLAAIDSAESVRVGPPAPPGGMEAVTPVVATGVALVAANRLWAAL